MRALRWTLCFIGHFLVAEVATNMFSNAWGNFARTADGMFAWGYTKDAILAAVLGYFVFYKWRSTSAQWIWTVGVVAFAVRVAAVWHDLSVGHSVLNPVHPTLAGVLHQTVTPTPADLAFFHNLSGAFSLVRTAFYSLGAWIASRTLTLPAQPPVPNPQSPT
jgi:hypothetical protein